MPDESSAPRLLAAEQVQPACARCGNPDSSKFGDEFICDDCYTACGSCCAGEEEQ